MPRVGQHCTVLRVEVTGQSLEGDPVSLERAGLSLPVMPGASFGKLADDELVTRRLVELAAAEALMGMRSAAAAGDWSRMDSLLEAASRQFAGNEWVAAVLEAMRSIAAGRERERAMKGMSTRRASCVAGWRLRTRALLSASPRALRCRRTCDVSPRRGRGTSRQRGRHGAPPAHHGDARCPPPRGSPPS